MLPAQRVNDRMKLTNIGFRASLHLPATSISIGHETYYGVDDVNLNHDDINVNCDHDLPKTRYAKQFRDHEIKNKAFICMRIGIGSYTRCHFMRYIEDKRK